MRGLFSLLSTAECKTTNKKKVFLPSLQQKYVDMRNDALMMMILYVYYQTFFHKRSNKICIKRLLKTSSISKFSINLFTFKDYFKKSNLLCRFYTTSEVPKDLFWVHYFSLFFVDDITGVISD